MKQLLLYRFNFPTARIAHTLANGSVLRVRVPLVVLRWAINLSASCWPISSVGHTTHVLHYGVFAFIILNHPWSLLFHPRRDFGFHTTWACIHPSTSVGCNIAGSHCRLVLKTHCFYCWSSRYCLDLSLLRPLRNSLGVAFPFSSVGLLSRVLRCCFLLVCCVSGPIYWSQ